MKIKLLIIGWFLVLGFIVLSPRLFSKIFPKPKEIIVYKIKEVTKEIPVYKDRIVKKEVIKEVEKPTYKDREVIKEVYKPIQEQIFKIEKIDDNQYIIYLNNDTWILGAEVMPYKNGILFKKRIPNNAIASMATVSF